LYVVLTIYLVHGTGIVTDDFSDLDRLGHGPWFRALIPEGNMLNVPVFNALRMIFYYLSDLDSILPIEAAKTVYAVMALYMITRFLALYLDPAVALTVAFLFVFYPSHESTVYWLAGQYLTLALAFYCFAYYQARQGRLVVASVLALLASFTSYASPPIAWSLFLICPLRGPFREVLFSWFPNVSSPPSM